MKVHEGVHSKVWHSIRVLSSLKVSTNSKTQACTLPRHILGASGSMGSQGMLTFLYG